ncbi:response regulator [Oligoflexus tunisiensis]|uniref:response regulator n=1 Tax=Oligoflexus tunisiensis TaxID=708132 RepID=UPI000A79A9CB|nr:response regulator [Oligoflexus tunisiensis]
MTAETLQAKVLIVEDEPDWLALIEESVSKAGFSYISTSNGADALAQLQNETVFVILADLVMPQMDGIELCRHVRTNHSDLPFVLVTARADRQRAVDSLRAGVSDIIDKPFHHESIATLLRNFATRYMEKLREEIRQSESLLATFLDEARELLSGVDESLLKLEDERVCHSEIDRLFRKIHTIKGSSGAIKKAACMTPLAHAIEGLLSHLKAQGIKPNGAIIDGLLHGTDLLGLQIKAIEGHGTQPDVEEAIRLLQALTRQQGEGEKLLPRAADKYESRPDQDFDNGVYVPTEKLDSFMEMAGELIAVKNAFNMLSREPGYLSDAAMHSAKEVGQTLDKLSERMQFQLMEVRRVDMKKVFAKLPRIVRQVSAELKKDISLEIMGEDVSVDKSIANVLSGCLSHAVRNALDHGLETTEERQRLGKSSKGRITIKAENLPEAIRVTVEDDGHGIDRQRVLEKALNQNLITEKEARQLSDDEIIHLIFRPGFSTAERVTNISGRGVGMDAIQTAIQACHGTTAIESIPGVGTKLILTIPVLKTINVERSILLESSGALYAVPLKSVSSIHTLKSEEVTPLKNHLSFQFRGRATRVASYKELCRPADPTFRPSKADCDNRVVVVISNQNQQIGLMVDQLLGQFDAVIRPFNRLVGHMRGFDGTALVGNGKIAYVVSPTDMIDLAGDPVREAV